MRAIKFRVWNSTQKYMEQVETLDLAGLEDDPSVNMHYMQYTGLKDKNGTPIYEGDIVKASLLGDGKYHGYKDEVQFRGAGIIEIDPLNLIINFKEANRESFYIYESILHRDTEVIGNIYENPDLLKRAE